MKTEPSTHTSEPRESWIGRPPPPWLGPVTVTVGELERDWDPRSSELRYRLLFGDDETLITTVGPLVRRSLTVSYLLGPGQTTPPSSLSTYPLRYMSVWPKESLSTFTKGEMFRFYASTDPEANAMRIVLEEKG